MKAQVFVPKSFVPGIVWPAFAAGKAAQHLALAFQLQQSQWWSPEDLLRVQLVQVRELLIHAERTVEHYRRILDQVGLRPSAGPLTIDDLRRIPVLTRAVVQELGPRLRAADIPAGHGNAWTVTTSGSTGQPVAAMQTEATEALQSALSLRALLWHRRDPAAKQALIIVVGDPGEAPPPAGRRYRHWDPLMTRLVDTGPSSLLSVIASHAEQKEWLLREDPVYLTSHPTNVVGLARVFGEDGARLRNLREILTMGETLTPAARALAREVFGVPLSDTYSCREVGSLAFQCPHHEHYHVAAENVLLEVLHEDGRPCEPGEIGSVVVTHLHNFATPFVRYVLGDFAEVGEPCDCGRGLPVLTRIMGRKRHMLVRPDGSTYFAAFGMDALNSAIPHRQVQLVQTAVDALEVRLVPLGPVTEKQREALVATLHHNMGYPFEVELKVMDEIPRGKGGKYEDFVSLLPGQQQ
jgi:phenylacetate-CoA ligase